jgi:hypothetical protein
MDATKVFRILDLIPDRTVRGQSGVAFVDVHATSCVHPERLALLSEFLHWLSPIYPTTKDDQMRFGLFANKQAHADEVEEDETVDVEEETLV